MNLMLSIMDRLGDMMATAQAGDGDASADAADEGGEINSMMSNLGDLMEQMVGSEVAGNATEEAASQVDITGYNYAACRYEKDGITYPNRILVGSETYPGDLDRNWELVEKLPYLIGDFDWTAFDYLGEAGIGKVTYGQAQGMSFYAPYPYKAAYCGDLNLIGDMRPVAYWRQLIWGLRKAPYVCAQPPAYHGVEKGMTGWSMTDAVRSWNWAGYEGKPITVEVYADADEAALYVNGELIEKKAVGETKKFVALFETVYTPGTLETVVYRKGQEIGRDTMVTASEDVHIDAYADKVAVPADESDICYVEIALKDAQDNLNPGCDKAVTILVEGPGRILGFGSADPQSEENYFDTTAKAYEGRLRAAIRGTGEKGTITVTLKAEGCEDVKVQVEAE
jgi:beta-galactosidase